MSQQHNRNIGDKIMETTLMARKGRKIYPITGNEMANLGFSGLGVTLLSGAASYFMSIDERTASVALFVLAVGAVAFNLYTIWKIKKSATPFEY